MPDRPETPDNPENKPQPLHARFRGTRWPGLIWAVPVAAAAIVLWLGLEAALQRGPEISVVFPTTGGLKAGTTKVEYRGMTVGHVDSIRILPSLDRIKVSLRFENAMKGHLGRGTVFWIGGRTIALSNLSSIKSLISGPYIGVAPQSGHTVNHFTGLAHEPVLHAGETGLAFILHADRPGNLSRGAGIYYNHFKIGKVVRVAMDHDGQHFTIDGFVQQKYANLISTRSRFWNAGGVSVKTGGSGPRLMLQSIPALVSGAVGVETRPGGKPAKPNAAFRLYGSESTARQAPGPYAVRYHVVLAGGPHGLAKGAVVTLEGSRAGTVTRVAPRYDFAAGRFRTDVRLALEPADIPLAPPAHWNLADPAPQMNAMLSRLIARGLRARMAQQTPVIGGKSIALDIVAHAPKAALGAGSPPEIPSAPGNSINRIMAQVSGILADIHSATSRIAAVSRSPRTKRTLERLDRTITHVDAITRTANAQMPQLLANLRRATAQADAAIRDARGLIARNGNAANAPESSTLPRALYELSRAARSLRELTDYLSGHPNAVIFGKGR